MIEWIMGLRIVWQALIAISASGALGFALGLLVMTVIAQIRIRRFRRLERRRAEEYQHYERMRQLVKVELNCYDLEKVEDLTNNEEN